ncbi:NAD(P)/FAD-dependent oxidoreductase [Streptomyces sp. PKU-EA00015]|uniref:flavin-containing monooxygenase n=1 Tax=Streptomyces sp. PKU-EA00015 TaxID=2748326 RepID=UPI001C435491|nr:NAD(P)/FAD-dependent oxidoreductase [Streptomyces sp. PKU-EA00015]
MTDTCSTAPVVDVLCIGAGFSGLYAAYKAAEQGWTVAGFETAPDVGGTWFWNTYPGARCDVESIYYSYSFSEELQQEWTWSERFAPQAEILSYINYVADRFDLRRHFRFDTKVIAANWLPGEHLWELTLDSGDTRRGRYLLAGSGGLSTPKAFDVPGLENFTGLTVSTSRWTISLDELAGKRVAVIGTGSSGVQCIPLIAEVAAHLTVFQRTPNYVFPARNAPIPAETVSEIKSKYPAIREECRQSPGGIPDRPVTDCAFDVSDEERQERYERAYERSGFLGVGAEFADLLTNPEANETAAEFVRQKIRQIVHDPRTASLLEPLFHPLGAKRSCFGTDFYETFNRPNVSLVSLRDEPIATMTSDSIITEGGSYDVDAIVLAIGFDAFTGPPVRTQRHDAGGRQAPGRVERRRAHLPGRHDRGIPQLLHDRRPPEPRAGEQRRRDDRAGGRLDRRPDRPCRGRGQRRHRSHPRGPGRLGGHHRGHGQPDAVRHHRLLVPRLQRDR